MAKGGAREGAGRKVGFTTGGTGYKTGRIVISCTKEMEQKIKDAAKEANKNVSEFMLEVFEGRK